MSDYKPRQGSIIARALEQLQIHGEMATTPLADAIEADTQSLGQSLDFAIKHGAISVTKRRGLNWYRVGDGTPPKRRDSDEDEGAEEQAPAKRKPIVGSDLQEHFGASALVEKAIEPSRDFECGLFSDGRFVIEIDGQRIVLQRERAEKLIRFVDRLAPEAS